MGFEIPVDSDYFDHPKSLRIRSILGQEADVYPIRLFAWASKYAPTGVIMESSLQIEEACKWRGDEGKLYRVLVDCGFIEEESGNVRIHNWDKYSGYWLQRWQRRKEQKRKRYWEEEADSPYKGIMAELVFMRSPGPMAKKNALEDLERMGTKKEDMLAKAKSTEARTMSFYDFISWCKNGTAEGHSSRATEKFLSGDAK